jgi:hypothetical protein
MACSGTALLFFYFYAGRGLCDGLITRPKESKEDEETTKKRPYVPQWKLKE